MNITAIPQPKRIITLNEDSSFKKLGSVLYMYGCEQPRDQMEAKAHWGLLDSLWEPMAQRIVDNLSTPAFFALRS